MHVYLIGYMGAGKSTWGARLARETGAAFVDLDQEVADLAGRSIAEIFRCDGEPAFRALEREVLGRLAESGRSVVIACGGGTSCDLANRSVMRSTGRTLWLSPSFDLIWERLRSASERDDRPVFEAIGGENAQERVREHFHERSACYEWADRRWGGPEDAAVAECEATRIWVANVLETPQPTR